MSQSERPQSDANRIAIDNLPPSLRPRRWARVDGLITVDARTPAFIVCSADRDPDPDLDDQIEAAGEQPAP